jgi:hypothetical protein
MAGDRGGKRGNTDDGKGFEALDELVFDFLSGIRVVVRAECVFDEGYFKLGRVEGFELGLGDALVVVEDGDFDWRHNDLSHNLKVMI